MTTSRWAPLIERILCPLDLEQPTLGALRLASVIAECFGASLEAMYAGEASPDAERRLSELVRSTKASVAPSTLVVVGPPVPTILERASQPVFNLIVLGARQRSDLGWQFRDDVARQVAALADCATLTVHERETDEPIKRILLPVDFSAVTTEALEWAAALALKFHAEVQLLHVVSRERSTVRSLDRVQNVVRSSNVPADVTAKLIDLEQTLIQMGVTVISEVVIASSVVNGIADYNDRGEFDLLVVGMSGPPQSPPRLTRGVVATLRNRMSIPVLSVRGATVDSRRTASG
jgi:nucleotide-binding universal stress UspA family protein